MEVGIARLLGILGKVFNRILLMGSMRLTLLGLCFSMVLVLKLKTKKAYRILLEDLNYEVCLCSK